MAASSDDSRNTRELIASKNGAAKVEAYFSTSSFHDLFDFAKQYADYDGVAAIVESAKQRLVRYDEVRKQTIQEYQPKIDTAYSDFDKKSKWWGFAYGMRYLSIVLLVIGLFSKLSNPSSNLAVLALIALVVFVVLRKVFEVMKDKGFDAYEKVCDDAIGIATTATSQEKAANDQAMKAIDDIYLSTLSIADREAIITRRLQQQQLQEQRAHNQRMEASRQQQLEEQRAHNQQMEEDQRAHQQQVENEQRIHNRNVEDALNRH